MEERFGHDFSRVRVHTGAAAERSAQEIDASAYTMGHHIVFGSNQFAPDTKHGRMLLAHELTHVVQQSHPVGSPSSVVQRATTRGAGGCAPVDQIDEDDDGTRGAGTAAHRQIQSFLLPGILGEIEVPRATKRQRDTACQPAITPSGFADLMRIVGMVVEVGEIKPVGWAPTYGVEDVEHYILRGQQSIDRQFGLGARCPGAAPGSDDARFARAVQAGRRVPRAFAKMTGVLSNDTVIGEFDGDRSRTLKAKMVQPGAVGYWCTGGTSDTYTCGASQEETRAYIDRVLVPAQDVLARLLEEQVERPLARRLQEMSVRELLELVERHMGPQIREQLRAQLGPLADTIINRANAQQLGEMLDQSLGATAKAIAVTIARRFASQLMNELRVRLRNVLADMIRDTLATLCVGVPAVALVQLLDALRDEIKRRMRQMLPAVATAVAVAMVAEVVDMIQQAVADAANAVLRVLAVIGLVLLAVAIVVVGIIFLISLIDPVPGDEVAVGAGEAFLIQLFRSLAQFVFAAAESGTPGAVLTAADGAPADSAAAASEDGPTGGADDTGATA
jgi:hypothetical protein